MLRQDAYGLAYVEGRLTPRIRGHASGRNPLAKVPLDVRVERDLWGKVMVAHPRGIVVKVELLQHWMRPSHALYLAGAVEK